MYHACILYNPRLQRHHHYITTITMYHACILYHPRLQRHHHYFTTITTTIIIIIIIITILVSRLQRLDAQAWVLLVLARSSRTKMALPRKLSQVVCEMEGKIKCTNIARPGAEFKPGKMMVFRVGNSDSFSIGIKQTSTGRPTLKNTQRTIPVS